MAYTQQVWRDYPSGGTPVSAARLNHMEAGIFAAASTAAADAAQATASKALTTAQQAQTTANTANNTANNLAATVEPATGGFTPSAANWTLNRGNIIKIGRVASCDISVNYTGATITVGASGNIANTLIGTVSSAFVNWASYQGITAGPGGSVNSVYIHGNSVYLAAYAPNTNIVSGMEITFAGTWITAS